MSRDETRGRRPRFRDVLALREFRTLWAAELLSVLGDQLARMSLSVLVFDRTESASWTALTYALTYVPAMLGGVFLAGLADRYPRRELMVVIDLCRALVAGAMALPFLPLPVLLGLVFVLTFARGPFKAAQLALLPTVLPGDTYLTGLSVRHMTIQAAQLAGFLAGGVLLVLVDPYVALGLNAGTFVVSALLVAVGVRRRTAPRAGAPGEAGGLSGAWRLIWRDRHVRGLMAVSWLVGLTVTPEGLAVPYAAGLGITVVGVGFLLAADPAGSIFGAWLAHRIPRRSHFRMITPLALAASVPLIAVVVRPGLIGSVALWAIAGACSTAYLLLAQEAYTRRTPDRLRGTVSGLASSGVTASQGIAVFGAGIVADATTPALAIASAGVAFAVLAGSVGVSWLRRPSEDAESDVVTGPCPLLAPPSTASVAELDNEGGDRVIMARRRGEVVRRARNWRAKLPSQWPLWRTPPAYLTFFITVMVTAITLTAILGLQSAIEPRVLAIAGALAGLGVAETEMARRVERDRRQYNDTPHVNLTAVWTVPAALVLPPLLSASVVLTLYLHLYWRSWYRVRRVAAFKPMLSAMVALLSCYTTWAVVHVLVPNWPDPWTQLPTIGIVVLALLARFTVNTILIGAAISFTERRFNFWRAFGSGSDNALEFGTLGLGAIAGATLLVDLHPAWLLLMVPAVWVLHRSVLIRQLEEAAATDPKTGLANATAWQALAATEIERASEDGTTVGVLMIDLDHFKAVNDTHGHLAGDQVLHAVANLLTKTVRRDDIVGRWGGEEFVVLCPDVSNQDVMRIGERVCEQVRRIEVPVPGHGGVINGLSVSIGVATFPEFGPKLTDVLLAADDALFVAKDSGRNQVQTIVSAIGDL